MMASVRPWMPLILTLVGVGTAAHSAVTRAFQPHDVTQRVGRCLAGRHPAKVAVLLRQEPSSRSEARVQATLSGTDPDCVKVSGPMERQAYFNIVVMRGAIAEGLVLNGKLAGVVLASSADHKFAPHSFPVQDPALDEATRLVNAMLFGLADCVVASEPVAARKLIESVAATVAEKDAFVSLTPAIGNCLPEGATVALERPRVRAAIAEAWYVAASRSLAAGGSPTLISRQD